MDELMMSEERKTTAISDALFELGEISDASRQGVIGDHDPRSRCRPECWPTELSDTDRIILARVYEMLLEADRP